MPLLSAALASVLLLAACNLMKAPWQPSGRAAPGASGGRAAAADSAATRVDSTREGGSGAEETRGEGEGRAGDVSPEVAAVMEAAIAAGRDTSAALRIARDSVAGMDSAAAAAAADVGEETPGPGQEPPPEAAEAAERGAPVDTPRTVAALRERGPTYVPYDRSPALERTERLTDLLDEYLLPAIEGGNLSLRTSALYWVLVTEEGEVVETVLHTTSTHEGFDEAAREVARRLVYRPARREGRRVPVWVLARISLLMP